MGTIDVEIRHRGQVIGQVRVKTKIDLDPEEGQELEAMTKAMLVAYLREDYGGSVRL